MAYKFQLGQAKLSGSIVQSDGTSDLNGTTVDSLNVSSGGISAAGAIAGVTTISGSGKFEMGSMALGGTDISATAAELNILDGVTSTAGELNLLDGAVSDTIVNSKAVIYGSAGEINGTSFKVGGNEFVTSEGHVDAIALSGTLAYSIVDGNGISDFTFANGASATISIELASANALEVGAGGLDLKSTIAGNRIFSNDVTVNGDLVVLGSTFSASVGTLVVEDALINIGDGSTSFAEGYGIEFGTSGSSWAHLKTVDLGGTNHLSSSLAFAAPSLYGATQLAVGNEWTLSDTHLSGNAPVSASAFYGDGSNLTGITADSASSVVFGTGNLDNNGTVSSKFTTLDSVSAAFTATLPALSGVDAGSLYILKDKKGNCGTNNVTIAANGSDTIDGAASILLESDYAAVSLVVVDDGGTKKWMIV